MRLSRLDTFGWFSKHNELLRTTDAADLTVQETVEHFSHYYQNPRDIDGVIDAVGLREKSKEFARNLSGGQRQIVNIIGGLINPSKILILDEPTNALDGELKMDVINMIRDYKKNKKCILVITHDKDIRSIFDEIVYV
jgi:ABC-2 type transport system ATP-binding protein